MNKRRTALVAIASVALACSSPAIAQTPASATEASLRETVRKYVDAWNRHDVKAWSAMLTDDIWYTESTDFYKRNQGRDAVTNLFGDVVKDSDLTWDITKVRMMPDGTATVVVRHVANMLPKNDGKYKASFESVPSVSSWRHENGAWRMFYFTSHKGSALDVMKKDGVE